MRLPNKVVSIHGIQSSSVPCPQSTHCVMRSSDNSPKPRCGPSNTTSRILHDADQLFRAGDQFSAVYIVRSGSLKTYLISVNGDQQVIGFHYPGDVIGIDAAEHEQHVCTAEALETTSVCAVDFDELGDLCSKDREMQRRILGKVAANMSTTQSMLMLLGQKSALQKIASFLHTRSHQQEVRGYSASQLTLPMSRGDIGSYLALAPETVSRALTRLQELRIIRVKGNLIDIVDFPALRSLVDDVEQLTFDGLSATAANR